MSTDTEQTIFFVRHLKKQPEQVPRLPRFFLSAPWGWRLQCAVNGICNKYLQALHPDARQTGKEWGQKMAERLQSAAPSGKIDQIYFSPFRRTRQTTQFLRVALPGNLPIRSLSLLREQNAGMRYGWSFEEVRRSFPWYDKMITRGEKCDPNIYLSCPEPGGESFRDLQIRAHRALEVLRTKSGTIVCVTHEGFIRAVRAELEKWSDTEVLQTLAAGEGIPSGGVVGYHFKSGCVPKRILLIDENYSDSANESKEPLSR
ncbi:MAG TPA: histidine phosphatase family protein [Candidatus Paceibacterota bacterium]|nr:histidine phosphatase family protein [Candidatus Paceibacterota bacterium]